MIMLTQPCLEGLKETLFLSGEYPLDYKFMFNSKKSKFMCFTKLDMQHTLIIAFQ